MMFSGSGRNILHFPRNGTAAKIVYLCVSNYGLSSYQPYRVRRKTMKKISVCCIAILLIATMLFGCGPCSRTDRTPMQNKRK